MRHPKQPTVQPSKAGDTDMNHEPAAPMMRFDVRSVGGAPAEEKLLADVAVAGQAQGVAAVDGHHQIVRIQRPAAPTRWVSAVSIP